MSISKPIAHSGPRYRNMLRPKSNKRYLTVSMGLLAAFVAFAALAVMLMGVEQGRSFAQLFEENPMVTLYFLLSMLHLFSLTQLYAVCKAYGEGEAPPDRARLWVVLVGELLVLNVFVAIGIFLFLRRQSGPAGQASKKRPVPLALVYALFITAAYLLLLQTVQLI